MILSESTDTCGSACRPQTWRDLGDKRERKTDREIDKQTERKKDRNKKRQRERERETDRLRVSERERKRERGYSPPSSPLYHRTVTCIIIVIPISGGESLTVVIG